MAIIWFISIIFPCHCAVYMYKIMILQKPQPISTKFHIDPSVEMWLIVYSNDHAPLNVRPIYSSSKLRTAQMIFSLVAMIGLEKCCITSACLQWLCHSSERTVAHGPLVLFLYLLGIDTLSGGRQCCQKSCCLPSYKGPGLKGKNFVPLGANVFFSEKTLICRKANKKSEKLSPLCKNYHVYPVSIRNTYSLL